MNCFIPYFPCPFQKVQALEQELNRLTEAKGVNFTDGIAVRIPSLN